MGTPHGSGEPWWESPRWAGPTVETVKRPALLDQWSNDATMGLRCRALVLGVIRWCGHPHP